MIALQAAGLAFVVVFVIARARLEAEPLHLYRRLFVLALSAWAAEDASVRLFGFHEYSQSSWLVIDRVPLLVAVGWPLAIQSARDLGTCLWAGRDRPAARRVALTVFGLVLADAALVEPILAQAEVVRWTQPGVFAAPPIAALGRATFGALAVYLLERAAWRHRPWQEALVPLLAPLGTHLALAAGWWGALRWLSVPLPGWPAVLVAWIVGGALAARAWQLETRRRVPPILIWLRLPAALSCLAVAALHAREQGALAAFALAFVPPYLAISSRGGPRR